MRHIPNTLDLESQKAQSYFKNSNSHINLSKICPFHFQCSYIQYSVIGVGEKVETLKPLKNSQVNPWHLYLMLRSKFTCRVHGQKKGGEKKLSVSGLDQHI